MWERKREREGKRQRGVKGKRGRGRERVKEGRKKSEKAIWGKRQIWSRWGERSEIAGISCNSLKFTSEPFCLNSPRLSSWPGW